MGIHDDEPLYDDDTDPELKAFQEETGCLTYEEFYLMEKEEEEEIDKIRETISINPWEKIAIGIGLERTAKRRFYSREHETPYEGEGTPDWWRGTLSLAKKIGVHLINPYNYYEFAEGNWSYEDVIKHEGYVFDEYGLVWYTEEEKANIGKEKPDVEYQEQPEILLPPEQVASMKGILGIQ